MDGWARLLGGHDSSIIFDRKVTVIFAADVQQEPCEAIGLSLCSYLAHCPN